MGMRKQPAPAIVNVNVRLRVAKERADHRILRYQLQVTGIYFDDIERLDLRVICQNLPPRTGGQADHQDTDGSGVKGRDGISADNEVFVLNRIDVEEAVIDAAAEDGAIVEHRNYAIPVFHKMCQAAGLGHGSAEGQAFIKAGIEELREKKNGSEADSENDGGEFKGKNLAPGEN